MGTQSSKVTNPPHHTTSCFARRKVRRSQTHSSFAPKSLHPLSRSETLARMQNYKLPGSENLYEAVYLGGKHSCPERPAINHPEKGTVNSMSNGGGMRTKPCRIIPVDFHQETWMAQSCGGKWSPMVEFHKTIFAIFMEFTKRIDAVKMRMIEYYGDDQSAEFTAIRSDLNAILREVRAITDKGDVRVIVTREQYEDYIEALLTRFGRLVEINKTQSKSSIFTGGTANITRAQRSNSNMNFM